MYGYIDQFGNYYEGDRQGQDLVVPQRPTPYHYWENGEWVYDPHRHKAALGKIPTEEFLDVVFAPPEGAAPDYSWTRLDEVTRVVPALIHKLPPGAYVKGTRQEITNLAQWLLAHGPDRQPVAVPGEGSIITQAEFDAVMLLLDRYGVQ